MSNYQKELKYFNNIYALIEHSEKCEEVKNILYKLLEFNTIEGIATDYNTIKRKSDIVFSRLEEVLKSNDYSLEEIRTIMITCAIDQVLHKKNDRP